jgi:hypothetical protein
MARWDLGFEISGLKAGRDPAWQTAEWQMAKGMNPGICGIRGENQHGG